MCDERWVACLLLLLCPAIPESAQRSANTSLVVQILPEVRIDPRQVPLQFRVDGVSDVNSVSSVLAVRARALPGQQIYVKAFMGSVTGPDGPVPLNALHWTASTVTATGGGQQASCSSGTFRAGSWQDIVQGWERSGTLSCAVSFQLARSGLTPGVYAGVVQLSVEAR